MQQWYFLGISCSFSRSKWRIDFPVFENEHISNEKYVQIISVCEKTLTRGSITLASPHIENYCNATFECDLEKDLPNLNGIDSNVRKHQKRKTDFWLDSTEETIFYSQILPKLLGDDFYQFVIPQIEISSLLPSNVSIEGTSHRRVDFAIFHPQLDEKIIVEIDGKQHNNHMEADRNRDEILENYGYTVIRIQASEIQEEYGTQLSKLESKLFAINNDSSEKVDTSITRFKNLFQSIKISHQIQLTILQAIQSNILGLEGSNQWHIVSDIDRLGIFISFSDERSTSLPTFHVQNIFLPFRVANSSFPTTPLIGGIINQNKNVLIFFIQYLFRKEEFWEGQFEGIVRALQGKDALLLLPTGAGKSLVYQLASLLLPGRTVVIDPIISLMDDLALVGIDRCIAITSQIIDIEDNIRAIQLFGQGEYLFTFIAPERFQTTDFRNSLRELTVHTPISLITVDEAHCVSERGHDFRTAYLNIGRTSRIYCKSNGNPPPLLAMTGTASRSVLKDVKRELQIEDFDAIITPKMFDRKELKFHIINAASQEKPNILNGFLGHKIPKLFNITTSSVYQTKGGNSYSGLVFCQNVRGNFGVENVSRNISNQLGISTEIYSGREPKHWKSDPYLIHKKRVTNEFKRNRFPLVSLHKSIWDGDRQTKYKIHCSLWIASIHRIILYCCIIVSNDDITRILYFHTQSFKGINQEMSNIEKVLNHLEDISKKGLRNFFVQNLDRKDDEKALHRILLIGVIMDYTIDYSKNEFTVTGYSKEKILEEYGKYIAGYLFSRKNVEIEKAHHFINLPISEFVINVLQLLVQFICNIRVNRTACQRQSRNHNILNRSKSISSVAAFKKS